MQRLLSERNSRRVVVPEGLPPDWLDADQPRELDTGFDARTLDSFHASVTGCAVAVAETGTIVLDGGPGQGRRAITLVPDHHICVVLVDQVVDTVPEAVAALASSVREGRPLTWISGPSATSDIELSRVEGVHGARKLDIVMVGEGEQQG
jgi:L-lactate dehydrogenase complex protein LldG